MILRSIARDPLAFAYFKKVTQAPCQMKFSEILTEVTDCAKQLVVFHIIEEVVDYYSKEYNAQFPELLRAWSDYAMHESNKERDRACMTTWTVVGRMLATAADKFQHSSTSNFPIELEVIYKISQYYRRYLLLHCVAPLTKGLERERCYFGDLLEALSNYARSETEKAPQGTIWLLVAEILATAAAESQKEDSELP